MELNLADFNAMGDFGSCQIKIQELGNRQIKNTTKFTLVYGIILGKYEVAD